MVEARDKEWRKKEPSLREVTQKYPDMPASWILKADIQRRGLWYAPNAVAQIDPAVHAVHQDGKDLFRNSVDFVPEGLIWNDGSYLIANFDFDQEHPAREPYIVDYVDGKYVIIDEGDILSDFQGFWEKPDFYNKKASNGEPLSTYVQARPQRIEVSVNKYCHFWDCPKEGCKYCPLSPSFKASGATEEQSELQYMREAFEEAFKQKGRFTQVLLTGGSILSGEELFDDELESYIRVLKMIGEFFPGRRFPSQLISSAFSERQLERLYNETGLTMYTTDIEVFDKEKFDWICPGKANKLGYDEWKRRLIAAVDIFGQGNVTSGAVLGTELATPHGFISEDEAYEHVVEEAESIISHGIALAANIWRPTPKSIFQNQVSPTLNYFVRVYREFDRLQRKYITNPYNDDFRRCGAHVGLDLMRTYEEVQR